MQKVNEMQPTTPPADVEAALATEADGQPCAECNVNHFDVMRNALMGIFDYCGNDIQAIKNTAYRALPNTTCLATRVSDASNEYVRGLSDALNAALETMANSEDYSERIATKTAEAVRALISQHEVKINDDQS